MTRHDQLSLDLNFSFAHAEGCPAPAFLDQCSVRLTAIGRPIHTIQTQGALL